MTWSIVTREPETGHLAIAVATRFFAVGSIVPNIRGGVGAVATQAFSSPLYGIDGLAMLAAGHAPEEIIKTLTARDEGREQRQFHMIDSKGNNAAFTGAKEAIAGFTHESSRSLSSATALCSSGFSTDFTFP